MWLLLRPRSALTLVSSAAGWGLNGEVASEAVSCSAAAARVALVKDVVGARPEGTYGPVPIVKLAALRANCTG
jgi:hypothetical protein